MKKYFLFAILVLLINFFASAQGKLVVIYADPSANETNYALSNKLYDALQETDNRMLLYISKARTPIVSNSIYDMKNSIDQLSKIKSITPNYSFDIDSINRLLNEESSLSNISTRESDIKDDIFFFFFFDAEKCIKENLIENFSERLLLSNRLINKNGLLPSCKIKIYLSNADDSIARKYIHTLKEEKGYDIIAY